MIKEDIPSIFSFLKINKSAINGKEKIK